jgi:hypothetical protein
MVAPGRARHGLSNASGVIRPSTPPRADRADDAGAADAAIALGVLGQVLLVIVLGEVERAGGADLGGDGPKALGRQGLLIGFLADPGRGGLASEVT